MKPQSFGRSLALLTTLFFLWGLITSLNDILIPHLKRLFELDNTRSMLIQLAFFGAYATVSIPAARVMRKIGFQRGIVAGLIGVALGACLFIPSARIESYAAFLTALFVLASGITFLQVAANPFVAALGDPAHGASRLNLTQGFNSLGTTIGPALGAALLLGGEGDTSPPDASAVEGLYLGLGLLALATAALFWKAALPKLESVDPEADVDADASLGDHPQLWWATGGIFLYVGAEVAIGSFLVFLLGLQNMAGLDEQAAGFYVSIYWGMAMVGRFAGAAAQRVLPSAKVLAGASVLALALLAGGLLIQGMAGSMMILAIGLANSVMFPTIFTLGVANLGPLTARGSGWLNTAIVGGAIVPILFGLIADGVGTVAAMAAAAPCYLYILVFALRAREATSQ